VRPFLNASDVQTAPAHEYRVPSDAARAAFHERLETAAYRTVLISPGDKFPVLTPPHVAQFWRLRLVEGYGTSVPTRLFALPITGTDFSVQHIAFGSMPALNGELLALLNVKHVLVLNEEFYRNAVPDGQGGWREARPEDVTIKPNPCPPVPRVFFARRARAVGDIRAALATLFGTDALPFRGGAFYDGTTDNLGLPDDWPEGPPPGEPWRPLVDVREESCVEGLAEGQEFAGGEVLHARFEGDRIEIDVEPAAEDRFLVLNELYHPRWHAFVDGKETPVYPTNVFMRGLVMPAGTRQVRLEFQPFVCSRAAWGFYGSAACLALLVGWRFRRVDRRAWD
jgi:hypothetical protein